LSDRLSDEDMSALFKEAETIAIVGLSDDPRRDSYRVASYLQSQGYTIIPINPMIRESLGQKAYTSLRDYGKPVDIVNVFRKSEAVDAIVDDVIAIGIKVLWTQLGIVNASAAKKAKSASITVVMDRCIAVEHRRLLAHVAL